MAISVFPIATSASASGLSKAVNLTTSATYYTLVDATLTAGNYTITSPSTVPVQATFYNASYESLATGTTTSGSVQIILTSDASRITLIADSGSNVAVTIQLTGLVLTPNFTSAGTETITSTQTYSGTSTSGYAFALLVGGGGSGGSRGYYPGGGGGSGGVRGAILQLTGSLNVQVGSAEGTTSASGLSATGGSGGGSGGGGGGTPNGVPGGSGGYFGDTGGTGGTTANVNKYILDGTTGGGGGSGGKSFGAPNGPGGGSGIGTGGAGGNPSGSNATGYGAGGGGGKSTGGGSGTQGVIYIRRF
jgi:hypothetical protein